jgi:DivIVA domain-containing protein
MALDRQSIEKRDFPIGRRGYDPAAVDAHLTQIAAEVEELRLSASRRRNDTLASSASEQVRAIVEAAEASAAEIVSQAEAEARELRTEAALEAQSTRSDASQQARDYVGRVSESTAVMLQRLNAMDSALAALIDGLRTGSNRLNADLQLLESNFEDVRDATAGPLAGGHSEAPPAPLASTDEPDEAEAEVEEHEGTRAVPAEPVEEGSLADAHASSDTEAREGARLVALNMALNGTARAETDRYLAANFDLEDREGLLDDVYATVEH